MKKVRFALAGLFTAVVVGLVFGASPRYDDPPVDPLNRCLWSWNVGTNEWLFVFNSCHCPEGSAPSYPTYSGKEDFEYAATGCQEGVQAFRKPTGGPVMDNEPRPMPSTRE